MFIRMQVHNYVSVQLNAQAEKLFSINEESRIKNMDQLEFLINETNFRENVDDSVTKKCERLY